MDGKSGVQHLYELSWKDVVAQVLFLFKISPDLIIYNFYYFEEPFFVVISIIGSGLAILDNVCFNICRHPI